jgi:hypothetical protein
VVLGGDGEGPRKKRSKRETIFDIDFHRIVLDEAVSSFYICDVMDLLWSTELLCLE